MRTTPSQAEGDRESVEWDLCQKDLVAEGREDEVDRACGPIPADEDEVEVPVLPSQAEGER
ncbi:MAG: hypothetical protein ACYC4R_03440 [Anaerolineae bacterium]